MTDIDRLRNAYIDSMAEYDAVWAMQDATRTAARELVEALKETDFDAMTSEEARAYHQGVQDGMKRGDYYEGIEEGIKIGREEISNIDVTPNRPEIGRKFELKGRSEQWGNLWIAEERGVRPLPSGSLHNWATFDASVADGSSEWRYPQKDDAKQDPTDIEIAIDFGEDGVTYIHPLQGAWTPVYRFDEKGQIRDTIKVRVEGDVPERQYTEDEIRKAFIKAMHGGGSWNNVLDELRRND